MTMRSYWIVPAIALGLAACGPSDKCEVPVKPALLDAKHLSREQRANALGVPPARGPKGAVTESRGALAPYEDYFSRHNDAAQAGYCLDNEAYKARNMRSEERRVGKE